MKLLSIFYILSCSCWKWQCAGLCSEKLNAKKTRLYFYNVFDVYFNSNKLYNLRVDAVAMFVENFNLKQNGFKSLFLIHNPFILCCLPSVKFIPYIICIIMTGNLLNIPYAKNYPKRFMKYWKYISNVQKCPSIYIRSSSTYSMSVDLI